MKCKPVKSASMKQMLAMPCGHAFCFYCWELFCENAVEEGPSCSVATCPQDNCTKVITEDEVTQALGASSPFF
jgi:hypothetical protein